MSALSQHATRVAVTVEAEMVGATGEQRTVIAVARIDQALCLLRKLAGEVERLEGARTHD